MRKGVLEEGSTAGREDWKEGILERWSTGGEGGSTEGREGESAGGRHAFSILQSSYTQLCQNMQMYHAWYQRVR